MDWVQKEGKTSPPELLDIYRGLEESYKKRLWDTMSLQLASASEHPAFATSTEPDGRLKRLYDNFVKKFETKINQIRFVQFAVAVAKAEPEAKSGLAFLAAVQESVRADKQAFLLAQLEQMRIKIRLGVLEEVKVALEDAKTQLESFVGIMESLIYSVYHLTATEYHKAKDNAQEFFNNSLLYLTYTPLATIPLPQQIALASDVGLAALVGRNTYNFGELLQHPILRVLTGTPHEWIGKMLSAFNSGNIRAFREIFAAEAKTPVLASVENVQFLNEKIRIMAFMEMVFKRDSKDRKITFTEVAAACEVKETEVELLLMKAFSLKVVRGLIDEVDQTVRVRWVQPRVLDMAQIAFIRDALKVWSAKVQTTALFVQQNAPEILS